MTWILQFNARYWLPLSLTCLALISLLSLLPLAQLPPVPGSDKLQHLLAYCALMFPVALRRPARWLWLGLLFIGWSGAIELLQPLVNRYAQWSDLLANVLGLALGAGLGLAARRWLGRGPVQYASHK